APIAKTLRPVREESVDFDTTKNLFIEGDNLDALKLLQESYLGKVKLIYIDPPYNTGNDFVYEDDFAETVDEYLLRSGQTDESGAKLTANPESNGRFHSDWLAMMLPRLKLARALLSRDGVLCMSIDDNEAHNLRRLTEEVFGPSNFVAQVAVQVNPRGRHLDRFVAKTHDSILIFVRDAMSDAIRGIAKSGRMADEYRHSDERGPYRLLGLRNRNQAFNPDTRPNLYFPLYVSPASGYVGLERNAEFSVEVWPDAPDGTKTCWTWGREKVRDGNSLLVAEQASAGEWRVYRKDYLYDGDGEAAKTLVKSLWLEPEFSNDQGRRSIKELFGAPLMDFPKSPDLLGRLIEIGCAEPRGIVMDFFAGSCTTAHAVMSANARDDGERRFVMVQVAEACDPTSAAFKAGFSTVASLGTERIRRAGKVISEESDKDLDVGFRLLRVDSTNMTDVLRAPDGTEQEQIAMYEDSVKAGRQGEDLLFQVLLDSGLELSLPIDCERSGGCEVLTVDGGALIACFDSNIEVDFVREIASREPLRAVFRDSAFATDADRINAEQIFAEVSPSTDVKVI
ncbi:MAG: site-specific DNA-methyltransferase, partial [Planctomycetaceae bacterium]|nr:site-specific DNA-methyltransferase [Planctomycetaceae bacterium]